MTTRNKVLLLLSSLVTLALLGVALAQEHVFSEWRRIQRASRSGGQRAAVRLRQVYLPSLKVADRCVSCHLAMAPGEQDATGPAVVRSHPPVGHDPQAFGCTPCHGGQGRATEKEAAHGNVEFWPLPMIPKKYAYAGCGTCHTHLPVTNLARLEKGRRLFEAKDCLACHRVDGRGGTMRPGGAGGMEGPDLSRAGARGFALDWYENHLAAWKERKSQAWAASFGPLTEQERESLSTYLRSRVGAPGLMEAKALFHSLGCRGCHKVEGVGGDDGPDLTKEGLKDPGRLDFTHVPGGKGLDRWLAEHFRAPGKLVPGSQMPVLGLSEPQIDMLVYYLLSLRRTEVPDAFWPKDRIRVERFGEREFATDGPTLYGTFCAACHGSQGQGMRYPGMPAFPAIANPDFLAVASDDFLATTLRKGRPGRRMPAWGEKEGGLRPGEIATLVSYIRDLGGVPAPPPSLEPRRWAKDPEGLGGRLYGAYCSGCHGPQGEGGEGPMLRNPVLLESATDRYLFETVSRGRRGTAMEAFTRPSAVRPALSPKEVEALVAHLRSWEERKP